MHACVYVCVACMYACTCCMSYVYPYIACMRMNRATPRYVMQLRARLCGAMLWGACMYAWLFACSIYDCNVYNACGVCVCVCMVVYVHACVYATRACIYMRRFGLYLQHVCDACGGCDACTRRRMYVIVIHVCVGMCVHTM